MLRSVLGYEDAREPEPAAAGGAAVAEPKPEQLPDDLVRGENGHVALLAEACGDPLVALDSECQRKQSMDDLAGQLNRFAAVAQVDRGGMEMFGRFIAYLRDPRSGKGERATFQSVVRWMIEKWGVPVLEPIIPIIANHGYQKDFVNIWQIQNGDPREVTLTIERQLAKVLKEDMMSTGKISLLAKWLPRWRKGHATNALIDAVAMRVWSHSLGTSVNEQGEPIDKEQRMSDGTKRWLRSSYRKAVSELTTKLVVVEKLMCGNEWDKIVPKTVPSLATNKYRLAFLNLKKNKEVRCDDPKRKACAEAFKEAALAGKVNAAVMDVARLVGQMMLSRSPTVEEVALMEAQWDKLEETLGDSIVGSVPLIDVSGSMSGTPMEAAIGIGLMIARKNVGPLRGIQFTFETTPKMCRITGSSAYKQVKEIANASWGGSTNFQAALDLLFQQLADRGEVGTQGGSISLVVLSDMQVNEALPVRGERNCATLHTNVVKSFARRGWGQVPPIVFWNLRATGTMPARADVPGVVSMSGQSAQLARAFLNGESVEALLSKTAAEKLIEVLLADTYDDAAEMGGKMWEIVRA